MTYSIHVDHKNKIIRYKHSGLIKPEEIGYIWENEFLKMNEFTSLKYNLLSDYSDAIFDIPLEFLPELMEFMKKVKPIVEGKKQSIIIGDPESTALSLIFENEVNREIGFLVKIFNTEKAALDWLLK